MTNVMHSYSVMHSVMHSLELAGRMMSGSARTRRPQGVAPTPPARGSGGSRPCLSDNM